ncbi:hypothetical protein [Parasphingorhabdus sp.]|uniref:hypothetical protein n=1 Tax=Parasphingorhabdus sp. TaxID=2709688 RepID=UPI003C78D578
MIEAKIFLLMFIWPTGQMEDKPLWTNGAYLTVESCEEYAVQRRAAIAAEYGAGARVEHYCFDADDRMDK